MALQMTLEAKYNHMATDFVDAYWKITSLTYDTVYAYFNLQAYPSRESSKKEGEFIENRLPVGGPEYTNFRPVLYCWQGIAPIQTVFPSGIPLDPNQQKTAIYGWIKEYTGLPFEDVFEDGQN